MSKLTLETTKAGEAPQPMASMPQRMVAQNSKEVPGLGSINSVRAELDSMFEKIRGFETSEPDETMVVCSALSARLSEIRMRIHRVESVLAYWKSVRTQEVDPAIEEVRFQYNLASRLLTQRQLDWDMSKG